ncbi:MAG: hypothetical protein WDA47_03765 [Bacilli bacterium]
MGYDSILNRARTYKKTAVDIRLLCRDSLLDTPEMESQMEILMGFIWLSLKLLESGRVVDALNQLFNAKAELDSFLSWVRVHIKRYNSKVILLERKIV